MIKYVKDKHHTKYTTKNSKEIKMRNYQNGKIYTVRSRSRVYVGSTIQPLSVRMGMHRESRNICRSKQVVDIGDAYIELLELFPCNSKEELNRREGHFQRSMDCVNKNIAGRLLLSGE